MSKWNSASNSTIVIFEGREVKKNGGKTNDRGATKGLFAKLPLYAKAKDGDYSFF